MIKSLILKIVNFYKNYKRKNILHTLIGVVLFVIFLLPFLIQDNSSYDLDEAIRAVPPNASFIVETRTADFPILVKKLEDENQIWKDIKYFPAIKNLNKKMRLIDSLLQIKSELRSLMAKKEAVISIHQTGKDDVNFLFIVNIKKPKHRRKLTKELDVIWDEKASVAKRRYDNRQVFDVTLIEDRNLTAFSYVFLDELLVLSTSSLLVEESVRQFNTGVSLASQEGFVRVAKTIDRSADANIFYNYKNLVKLFSILFNDNTNKLVKNISDFAYWSACDVNLYEDAVLINGNCFSGNDDEKYLSVFLNQTPQDIDIPRIFPAKTSAFVTFAFDNLSTFEEDYRLYLTKKGRIVNYENCLRKFEEKFGENLAEIFYDLIDNEIALLWTNFNTAIYESFVVIEPSSKSKASDVLLELKDKYAELKNIPIEKLTSQYKFDEEHIFTIHKLDIEGIFSNLFGEIFTVTSPRYYTFIDDYLIFGESYMALTQYIDAYSTNQLLINNPNYQQFVKSIPSESNILAFANISYSLTGLSKILGGKVNRLMRKYLKSINKFQNIALSFSSKENLFYTNLFLKHNPTQKNIPIALWQTRLDTSIAQKPQLVKNHYTKNNEVIIQDAANKIYQIDSFGKIMWENKIDGKIQGEIHQIDRYNNSKLQLLFNTENSIYLIDRKGKNVEGFPVKLEAKASNSLSVFDYDKKKKYRIFIACQNKKVYVYNKKGEIIEGWKFKKSEDLIKLPIQHFKIKDKDYIITSDEKRIYILDRKGKERVKIKGTFLKSQKSNFYLDTQNSPRLVTTDPSGSLLFIYFDGTVVSQDLASRSVEHYFDYQDINNDGIKDYVFLDRNLLEVYKHDKTQLFSREFDQSINTAPHVYHFPEGNKIGITSKEDKKIFLIENNGKNTEGFPLDGNTPFSIGVLNKNSLNFNLLVGNEESFLYNYEVHSKPNNN